MLCEKKNLKSFDEHEGWRPMISDKAWGGRRTSLSVPNHYDEVPPIHLSRGLRGEILAVVTGMVVRKQDKIIENNGFPSPSS